MDTKSVQEQKTNDPRRPERADKVAKPSMIQSIVCAACNNLMGCRPHGCPKMRLQYDLMAKQHDPNRV